MKRSTFLLIVAVLLFVFGATMFFAPNFAARLLDIATIGQTLSVLRGMGGLIIGIGAINYFLRNEVNAGIVRGLLLTNIITHSLGLAADLWGSIDGSLTIIKMVPVAITHLVVGIGSLIYLTRLANHQEKT